MLKKTQMLMHYLKVGSGPHTVLALCVGTVSLIELRDLAGKQQQELSRNAYHIAELVSLCASNRS